MKKIAQSCVALLILSTFSSAYAAEKITRAQADMLQPFKEISVRGAFINEREYSKAINKKADSEGADLYFISDLSLDPRNESMYVIRAKLYKADALPAEQKEFKQVAGVYEYPKKTALKLEPFDMIRIRGYFPTPILLQNAVAKEAANKGAYAYYIDQQNQDNSNNVQIVAYVFKQDAAERLIQPEDAIPYDSEAGQLALAQGGEAAMQVERPGYYSSSSFNEEFYSKKFETSDSNNNAIKESKDATTTAPEVKVTPVTSPTATATTTPSILPAQTSGRYSVTLPDGRRIEELNDATAAKMVPFDSIKFKGYYISDREVSYQAGKRALDKGAKYYHIDRIDLDSRGPNKTIYVDLYR